VVDHGPGRGSINYIHGMTDWSVTATLMRDNQPVVTVVHLPLTATTRRGHTFSEARGVFS
jgi:fructose-1,6-bisphosphatase/inositol monophosphatase family enzyme